MIRFQGTISSSGRYEAHGLIGSAFCAAGFRIWHTPEINVLDGATTCKYSTVLMRHQTSCHLIIQSRVDCYLPILYTVELRLHLWYKWPCFSLYPHSFQALQVRCRIWKGYITHHACHDTKHHFFRNCPMLIQLDLHFHSYYQPAIKDLQNPQL